MTSGQFSTNEERWLPFATLLWIATRSSQFTEILADFSPRDAEAFLHEQRYVHGAPLGVTISDACLLLREKVASVDLGSPEWNRFRTQDGGMRGFNEHELRLMPNLWLLRSDVLRAWPDYPCVAAWRMAASREWSAPDGLCRRWLDDLSGGARLPMTVVVDLLAFGRAGEPDGLLDVDTLAARLVAARELFRAACRGKVEIFAQRAQRVTDGLMAPAMVRTLSTRARIEPDEFRSDALTLCLENWRWIGPASVAASYPERGRCAESVRYLEPTVDRQSMETLVTEWSGAVARSRTPAQDNVRAIVTDLWPNGLPQGLTPKRRNMKIHEEARKRGLSPPDAKTIREALK